MRITTPVQPPGARSLPAELKIREGRGPLDNTAGYPWRRMRAQQPGVWERIPEDYTHYSPLSGLGFTQTICQDPTDPANCYTIEQPDYIPPAPDLALPPGAWQGPTLVAPNVNPPAPPAGYQWVNALNASGNVIAKVLAVAQGGAATETRYGQVIAGSPGSAASTGLPTVGAQVSGPFGFSAGISMPMILMIGMGLMVMMMGRR